MLLHLHFFESHSIIKLTIEYRRIIETPVRLMVVKLLAAENEKGVVACCKIHIQSI